MKPEIAKYNLIKNPTLLDCWGLRSALNNAFCNQESMSVSAPEYAILKHTLELVLLYEVKGWPSSNKPSFEESNFFIRSLLSINISIDIRNDKDQSLVEVTIENNDFEMFKLLIICGANINQIMSNKEPLIHSLARYPDKNNFSHYLLDIDGVNELDRYSKDANGNTAVMIASIKNEALIEPLIHAGFSIDQENKDNDTALLKAASNNNLKAIDILIKHGANPKAVNNKGQNLFSIAGMNRQLDEPELLDYLIETRLVDSLEDVDGMPILAYAINEGYDRDTLALLISPLSINRQCLKTGNTPLMATYCNQYDCEYEDEVSALLLDHGADPCIGNNENRTLIDILKERYEELDEEDRENYYEEIELKINKLAFRGAEIHIHAAQNLNDDAQNCDDKIHHKSSAIQVLKHVTYPKRECKKASDLINELQFEIATIYHDLSTWDSSTDLNKVIAEFNKVSKTSVTQYHQAKFAIANIFFGMSGNCKDEMEKKSCLIQALRYSDASKDEKFSAAIIHTLCGRPGLPEALFSTDTYERTSLLTSIIEDREKEIVALKMKIEEKSAEIQSLKSSSTDFLSASFLIGKRAASPVFNQDTLVKQPKLKEDASHRPSIYPS